MLSNCGAGEDRLLRVPWTARRSNQSILKEIGPEYPLEGMMLKLKLQYFGHLLWRTDSFEKTLMLGKIEDGRRRGRQRIRWLEASPTQWTWVWVNSRSWWWTGRPGVLQSVGWQRVGHNWATELNWICPFRCLSSQFCLFWFPLFFNSQLKLSLLDFATLVRSYFFLLICISQYGKLWFP